MVTTSALSISNRLNQHITIKTGMGVDRMETIVRRTVRNVTVQYEVAKGSDDTPRKYEGYIALGGRQHRVYGVKNKHSKSIQWSSFVPKSFYHEIF